MNEVVIVSAVRTAGGRIGGSLKDVQPEDLATVVIRAAIERAGVEPEAIDEVIIGQAKQSADAANLARVAALRAGLPVEVPAYTVMRQCGSGLQAVNNAAQAIMCGLADIVVAGGTESMSNAPYYLRGARFGYGAGNAVLVDSNTESQPRSQPCEIYGDLTMGLTAENVAEQVRHHPRGAGPLRPGQPGEGARGHRRRPVRRRDSPGGGAAEERRWPLLVRHRRASRGRPAWSNWPSSRPSSRKAAASPPATRRAATTGPPASC